MRPPDTGLPIEGSIAEVREALTAPGGLCVLTAEPGAGKTTVVPLRLLGEPWLAGRRIVVLEPRRVATRAAARRMSELMGDRVGGIIGYHTRDDRRVSASTRVEVVTEGVLTRRLQSDRRLAAIGLVIFDEFHERNLQADLGLALTLDTRQRERPDLRVLMMSATLDVKRLAAHLGGAPIVASEGRQHPVDIRWMPRQKKDRLEDATTAAITRALRQEEGDVLVFLPGAGEIRRVQQRLSDERLDSEIDVRPLYGALSSAEQDAALAPRPRGARRKVVLSTDIAETSITVEGVRVVVDAGLARVPRFDARTAITRLATISASKSSADQRAGRAGRVEPGVAYRLWSKLEHAARPAHLPPEITQVDLAGLALELAAWCDGAEDVSALPYLDPPPTRSLADARALLAALGATDDAHRITELGREMSGLPVHPRLAHMIIVGREQGDGWLACLLAALLEERDVLRGRPDELPTDLALRVDLLVDPTLRHRNADGRALAATRDRANDIARRADVSPGDASPTASGALLALAYPDRVAQNRSVTVAGVTAGRFRLRDGTPAWMPPTDALANTPSVVAVDLDGRRDPRIRLAAALAPQATQA